MRVEEGAERVTEGTLTETNPVLRCAASADVVAAHLFVALDCDHPESGVTRHSLANIDRVYLGRGPARSFERAYVDGVRALVLRIADARASAHHACLVRQGDSFSIEDASSRNGTWRNDSKISHACLLADGDLIQIGHTLLRYRAALATPLTEGADVDSSRSAGESVLATMDPSLSRRAQELARVARSLAPVIVLGETGTGKEVVARNVHRLSGRTGDFVAVNCGALPPTLVESQLFGHVRGAFSGATGEAPGLIRSADGGTLFLDEIGDLPAHGQVALLRALEEHEVLPVGASRAVKVDIRVVAATHRPLQQLVAQGAFRTDLFARIAGLTFSLPPMRDRPEDLGMLVAAFAAKIPIRLTPEAGRALLDHSWPLNVRELFQCLRVAAALAEGKAIQGRHLPPLIAARATRPIGVVAPAATASSTLEERLVASLVRNRGNVTHVARELGKPRTQVHRWLRRFAIEARSYREE